MASSWNRREVLRLGSLAGVGLLLPDLLRARGNAGGASGTFGRAKSVILLFLNGGHAQHETFDPKPEAPAEVRGPFAPIRTSVPGIALSELLPRTARQMHRLTLLRSLNHHHPDHIQSSLPALTGHHHADADDMRNDPPPSPTDFPPFGAVLDHLRPARTLPTWVQVGPLMRRNNGTILHGQFPGFLGPKHAPLVIDHDLRPDNPQIDTIRPGTELSVERWTDRRDLLRQVDAQRRLLDQAAEAQRLDAFQRRALNLVASPSAARAFDLAAEPTKVRDGYGRTPFGQCCLLARRLAEAGVPMITVHYCRTPVGSWDTHSDHFNQMKDSLCPTFDQAFSALVADLDQRGLLGQTLVLATAEFGRTPRVNSKAGRDHWPWVYSVALAGAGVAAGLAYGSSDRMAARPSSHPHDPSDLAATVYHLLGVPADTVIYDQTRRPHNLVAGRVIEGLLG
jgi:uncharacterized protein (DUF1501 family)